VPCQPQLWHAAEHADAYYPRRVSPSLASISGSLFAYGNP